MSQIQSTRSGCHKCHGHFNNILFHLLVLRISDVTCHKCHRTIFHKCHAFGTSWTSDEIFQRNCQMMNSLLFKIYHRFPVDSAYFCFDSAFQEKAGSIPMQTLCKIRIPVHRFRTSRIPVHRFGSLESLTRIPVHRSRIPGNR